LLGAIPLAVSRAKNPKSDDKKASKAPKASKASKASSSAIRLTEEALSGLGTAVTRKQDDDSMSQCSSASKKAAKDSVFPDAYDNDFKEFPKKPVDQVLVIPKFKRGEEKVASVKSVTALEGGQNSKTVAHFVASKVLKETNKEDEYDERLTAYDAAVRMKRAQLETQKKSAKSRVFSPIALNQECSQTTMSDPKINLRGLMVEHLFPDTWKRAIDIVMYKVEKKRLQLQATYSLVPETTGLESFDDNRVLMTFVVKGTFVYLVKMQDCKISVPAEGSTEVLLGAGTDHIDQDDEDNIPLTRLQPAPESNGGKKRPRSQGSRRKQKPTLQPDLAGLSTDEGES